ncbi:hypothetical protein FRX31_022819 [Thalictrum thalictroides]|uniref:Uncharacterized protein n=1 Tax=Thalictrum thalictroides TaxID=46969 RepID=A0A7J6VR85_THATH|nr:hypothetical protein FRX31_022819 [Thalictrum thalictroides]
MKENVINLLNKPAKSLTHEDKKRIDNEYNKLCTVAKNRVHRVLGIEVKPLTPEEFLRLKDEFHVLIDEYESASRVLQKKCSHNDYTCNIEIEAKICCTCGKGRE